MFTVQEMWMRVLLNLIFWRWPRTNPYAFGKVTTCIPNFEIDDDVNNVRSQVQCKHISHVHAGMFDYPLFHVAYMLRPNMSEFISQ